MCGSRRSQSCASGCRDGPEVRSSATRGTGGSTWRSEPATTFRCITLCRITCEHCWLARLGADASQAELVAYRDGGSAGGIDLDKILGRPQAAQTLIGGHVDHISDVVGAFASGNVGKSTINTERDPVWNV